MATKLQTKVIQPENGGETIVRGELSRELALVYKNRKVVLTLIPEDQPTMRLEQLEFRLKGTRQSFRITTSEAFRYALRAALTGSR
jgi:hypothetical protein